MEENRKGAHGMRMGKEERLLRRARVATSAVVETDVPYCGERLIVKGRVRRSTQTHACSCWDGLQAVFPFFSDNKTVDTGRLRKQSKGKTRLAKNTKLDAIQLSFNFGEMESMGLTARATVSVSGLGEIDLSSMTTQERLAVLRGLLEQRKPEEPEA